MVEDIPKSRSKKSVMGAFGADIDTPNTRAINPHCIYVPLTDMALKADATVPSPACARPFQLLEGRISSFHPTTEGPSAASETCFLVSR